MKLVTDYLREAVARDGAAPALFDGERRVSYAELDSGARRAAAALRAAGVARGDRVALLMSKSAEAVVAIHAVLSLGCAYAPLDPKSPAERNADLVRKYRARAVIADRGLAASTRARVSETGALVLDSVDLAGSAVAGTENPPAAIVGAQVAAILTTSGSTGVPKGVAITHANLAAFVAWAVDAFRLAPSDRLLSHAPLQFDLSFFDLFAATAAGAATVLTDPQTSSPAQYAERVRAAEVTVWQSVPSAITLLVEALRRGVTAMPAVRCVLFAGERMPRRTLLESPGLFPNAQLYNVYGSTETNDTFMYRVPSNPADAPDPLPIGEPLPFVEYRVVDDDGSDVPAGAPGHLLVAAPTIMAGYISSTGEVTPAPRRDFPTRDVVSADADGQLRFHGRTDAIVKTNGYRVNTLEIEDHLRKLCGADEAAVVAVPDALIGTRLVAFVRLAEWAYCSALDLKVHCAAGLPKYAIPHRFEIVRDPLPASPTGKVDRQRLAARLLTVPPHARADPNVP